MRQNATIDQVFKEGLGEANFATKEEMWARLEQEMEQQPVAIKKRALLLPYLLFLLVGLSLPFWIHSGSNTKPGITHTANLPVTPDTKPAGIISHQFTGVRTSQIMLNHIPGTSKTGEGINSKEADIPSTAITATAAADDYSFTENVMDVNANGLPRLAISRLAGLPVIALSQLQNNTTPLATSTMLKKHKKWKVELEAGTDLFNHKKQMGYYGGMRLLKNIGVGVDMSAGLNYSVNKVFQRYRLQSKPTEQTEADAELNSLTMLRLPVQFRQQVPRTKFTCIVGLTPVYILEAAVYNVPNAYTGNPALHRKFTIEDMRRLNVLFSAGFNYDLPGKFGLEITGSYGLTELVRDGYINQSNINGNFKNVQAALIYQFK